MAIEQIIGSNHDPRDSTAYHDELVDEKTAAAIIDVVPGTLAVWRTTGRYGLPFLKIGRNVRYRRSDLEAWLDSRLRQNGTTA